MKNFNWLDGGRFFCRKCGFGFGHEDPWRCLSDGAGDADGDSGHDGMGGIRRPV